MAPSDPPAPGRLLPLAGALGGPLVLIGLVWDISWHRTIGRDTFWSPPHFLIYAGGLLAGLAGGLQILIGTFRPASPLAAVSVRVLGLRGPLGAWLSAWGGLAMTASAPFDNWWHYAYGLDVAILTPPHLVLLTGVTAITAGGCLSVLALVNRAGGAARKRLAIFGGFALGAFIGTMATFTMQFNHPQQQRTALCHQVAGFLYPALLLLAGALPLRFPATAAAAFYTLLGAGLTWILPLFPGEPRLSPIYNPVTRMVPPPFPLLLIAPALALDLFVPRGEGLRARHALFAGVLFTGVLLAVQWPFAELLLSPLGRTWLFASDACAYNKPLGEWVLRFQRDPALARGLLLAFGTAVLSAWAGIVLLRWAREVRR